MYQLLDIHWAQLTLIQVGVIFQLIAMGTYFYDSHTRRRVMHDLDEMERGHHDEVEEELEKHATARRAKRVRGEGFDEPMGDKVKVKGMTRTSKTNFRQSFNFRRHGT